MGRLFADVLVESQVLVELKAIDALSKVHELQLVNHLKATGIGWGVPITMGARSPEYKRKTWALNCSIPE